MNIFEIEIKVDNTNEIINKLNEIIGKDVFIKASEVNKND